MALPTFYDSSRLIWLTSFSITILLSVISLHSLDLLPLDSPSRFLCPAFDSSPTFYGYPGYLCFYCLSMAPFALQSLPCFWWLSKCSLLSMALPFLMASVAFYNLACFLWLSQISIVVFAFYGSPSCLWLSRCFIPLAVFCGVSFVIWSSVIKRRSLLPAAHPPFYGFTCVL